MFEAPQKTSLGHLKAVKQLVTVVLDLKKWKIDPEAGLSVYFRMFYVKKQTSASC